MLRRQEILAPRLTRGDAVLCDGERPKAGFAEQPGSFSSWKSTPGTSVGTLWDFKTSPTFFSAVRLVLLPFLFKVGLQLLSARDSRT